MNRFVDTKHAPDVPLYRDHSFERLAGGEAKEEEGVILLPPDCQYCSTTLRTLASDFDIEGSQVTREELRHHTLLDVCDHCGWWRITEEVSELYLPTWRLRYQTFGQTSGVLRHFDSSGVDEPLSEVERFLLARPSSRYHLNPRRLEELVADVFRLTGRRVTLTQYSRDGGIDLMLFEGSKSELTAVQVKRYGRKVKASAIREFSGALFLAGVVRGVFVTTSSYTRGAISTVESARLRGQYIELWSGADLLRVLGCSLRPRYLDVNDSSAPFFDLWNARYRFPEPGQEVGLRVL